MLAVVVAVVEVVVVVVVVIIIIIIVVVVTATVLPIMIECFLARVTAIVIFGVQGGLGSAAGGSRAGAAVEVVGRRKASDSWATVFVFEWPTPGL